MGSFHAQMARDLLDWRNLEWSGLVAELRTWTDGMIDGMEAG